MEQEKAKIRKEYERREGQVEVKKKMCVWDIGRGLSWFCSYDGGCGGCLPKLCASSPVRLARPRFEVAPAYSLACSEYSKQLNEQRIKVLSAREAAIQEIVNEAKLKLREVSKNPTTYKKLLTDLLVQVGVACSSWMASQRYRTSKTAGIPV